MKPIRLEICGWGPYKDVEVVEFNRLGGHGLFLITGATGAGKTTLFDAITYALYGALSGEVRDKERGGVRSDFAAPDTPTYVELEMEHDGRQYRIHRNPEYMRPRKKGSANALTKEKENAVLYLPGGQILEGVKEVNGRLQEILALDYAQFKQISMIAQGEFARLLTAPPRDKTKIFRQIFDTGIYERFTTELGVRARGHYQQVVQLKQQLEEQLRGLLQVLKEMDADTEQLQKLLGAEYLQYDVVETGLKQLQQEAGKRIKELQRDYEKQDEELSRLQKELQSREEENKQILSYQQTCKEGRLLTEQKGVYQEKECRLQKARAAMGVDGAVVALEHALSRCRDLARERERLQQEIREKEQQREAHLPLWEQRESAAGLIETMKQYAQLTGQYRQLELLQQDLEQRLKSGREAYLELEEVSKQAQRQYEEAVQAQRHAAIGLAARDLRPGVPCPVCGSLEHPAPAHPEGEILSEEELSGLEQVWKDRRRATEESYGQVVALQTRAADTGMQLRETATQKQERERLLASISSQPLQELKALTPEKAEQRLQSCMEQMTRCTAQLTEKRNRYTEVEQQERSALKAQEQADKAFQKQLLQCGLMSREEYEAVRMERKEQEALQREIEKYQEKVISNERLREHLEGILSRRELWENEALIEQLEEQRRSRAETLTAISRLESQQTEIKRVYRYLLEKQEQIQSGSREYGYIKELENIAGGNNSKKLVFEQYVLAGYFEEILLAANIRFRRMTGGRYEMHRIEEVGDGRIKDNLEIEVLDYYTGKYRSVRTLSGGETFKASLSLALGLSDVIQAASGGVRVDTLFIDEGFGALDSESLDQACETLMSLAEADRLIGIISHVPELKERIIRQIVVEKSGSGSCIHLKNC